MSLGAYLTLLLAVACIVMAAGVLVAIAVGVRSRSAAHRLRPYIGVVCPECEHTAPEASADCPCWEPGCACVALDNARRPR